MTVIQLSLDQKTTLAAFGKFSESGKNISYFVFRDKRSDSMIKIKFDHSVQYSRHIVPAYDISCAQASRTKTIDRFLLSSRQQYI